MNYFKTATLLIVFVLLSYAVSVQGQTVNGVSYDHLVFHLDASGEDLTDGLWNDQSPNQYHFDLFGTPTVNENGVVFDGDDHFELKNVSELHTDSLTWIIVFRADENYRDGILLRSNQNDGLRDDYIQWGSYVEPSRITSGKLQLKTHVRQRSGSWFGTKDEAASGILATSVVKDQSYLTLNSNRILRSTDGPNRGFRNHVVTRIGWMPWRRDLHFHGTIAEVMVFNRSLNIVEHRIVQNLLAEKWNRSIAKDLWDQGHEDVLAVGREDGSAVEAAVNSSGSLDLLSPANGYVFARQINDNSLTLRSTLDGLITLSFPHDLDGSVKLLRNGTEVAEGTMPFTVEAVNGTYTVEPAIEEFISDVSAESSVNKVEAIYGIDGDGAEVAATTAKRGGKPSHRQNRVEICHTPPRKDRTLRVAEAAKDAHLRHGDYMGPCGAVYVEWDNGERTDVRNERRVHTWYLYVTAHSRSNLTFPSVPNEITVVRENGSVVPLTDDGSFTVEGKETFTVTMDDDPMIVAARRNGKSTVNDPIQITETVEAFETAVYPNPFQSTATVQFNLEQSSDVRIDLWNVLGQRVETIVDQRLNSGNHEVRIDGSNLPSGSYFYTVEANGEKTTKRITLVR